MKNKNVEMGLEPEKELFLATDEDEGLRNARLREDIIAHLKATGVSQIGNRDQTRFISKDAIRANHSLQRGDLLAHERDFFTKKMPRLLEHFANGTDVKPEQINPFLEPVISGKWTGDLFRLATLLWSVPVSKGFGRRMRYLVRDRSNGKLIGLFALGDPVFNLNARDKWIGWTVDDRRLRLVNLMDAYVVGSVPPYSTLLGGKLVASLIASAEVSDAFSERYGSSTGIISGSQKGARLALVTVTSALGRSSLYHRLKLCPQNPANSSKALVNLIRIGETKGYGHFHVSNRLFDQMRMVLQSGNHGYANGHHYGQGPNWRMRVIRVCLQRLGLNPELIRHGIAREVYALPLVTNCREFLRGEAALAASTHPSSTEIARAALARWIIPRAVRRPEFSQYQKEELFNHIFEAEND